MSFSGNKKHLSYHRAHSFSLRSSCNQGGEKWPQSVILKIPEAPGSHKTHESQFSDHFNLRWSNIRPTGQKWLQFRKKNFPRKHWFCTLNCAFYFFFKFSLHFMPEGINKIGFLRFSFPTIIIWFLWNVNIFHISTLHKQIFKFKGWSVLSP